MKRLMLIVAVAMAGVALAACHGHYTVGYEISGHGHAHHPHHGHHFYVIDFWD